MEELLHPFELLRLLCNTPALEFLHVDLLVYEEPYMGTWQPPYEPIHLPLLRSLVFTDCPYKLLTWILPRISLPEDVFIRLQDISNYIPVYGPADPFPPLPIRPVTHLDIVMQGEEVLMVADSPTSGLWLSAMHDLDGFPEPQDWGDWLLSLRECLTLVHVTHLHIRVEGWETFWRAFLSHLPQLTHLTALFDESSDEPDDDTGEFDCPTATLCAALSQPAEGSDVPCPVSTP
uniref:Succinate-semialdehyde dehydrogenase (EC) n=1 Tax=Ganoderma boninense TaxID=34458 RepID=A0A5K1K633_9APHY|nr:Succinate-semialdehyde dehydrogenase (EC [Ganoderma boninense]